MRLNYIIHVQIIYILNTSLVSQQGRRYMGPLQAGPSGEVADDTALRNEAEERHVLD